MEAHFLPILDDGHTGVLYLTMESTYKSSVILPYINLMFDLVPSFTFSLFSLFIHTLSDTKVPTIPVIVLQEITQERERM